VSRPRRLAARRRTTALIGLLAGALVLVVALAAILVPRSGPVPTPSTKASPAAGAQRYLLVIDFLAYAAEAVTTDPIAGSPDAEELIPLIGDPIVFGAEVTDQPDTDVNASSRCGVIERSRIEAVAAALNPRLPADQQIDPSAPQSRALLHWNAAEGFASLRLFAQDGASPSCADAGKRF
jgi:hypothetical protein